MSIITFPVHPIRVQHLANNLTMSEKEMFPNIKPLFGDEKNTHHIMIAGPCSAESEEMTLKTACALDEMGVRIFRAGMWKPRTNPDSYAGPGSVGLKWLQRVKDETGMMVATEVATPDHVNEALDAGIDFLWIGARTTANPFAVQEIADTLADRCAQVGVLVKNPVNPDLELWIGTLQRIYNAGIRRIGAIHRGFSSFGQHIYRNEPQWQIPIELKRRISNLPIICDPSHMGGKPELIAPLSQQALDMGFDGLMIECHCNPSIALSDRQQQITPEALQQVLHSLVIRNKQPLNDILAEMRRQIDMCDDNLLEILNHRMELCRQIGKFKKENNMTIVQTERYGQILEKRLKQAEELGMNPQFVQTIMQAVHEEAVKQQVDILNS